MNGLKLNWMVCVLLLWGGVLSVNAAAPMNVLFIAIDDMRPNLGCYGDAVALSPRMDELAAGGTVFERAYCQVAVCNASRASIMTGLRPDTTRVWNNSPHFRKTMKGKGGVVTLPEYFKDRGYAAAAIGKLFHGQRGMQDTQSWTEPERLHNVDRRVMYLLPRNQVGRLDSKQGSTDDADVRDEAYLEGQVAAMAVETLGRLKGEPFFLAVGFRKPHLPFSAPRKYWDLYDRDAIAGPTPLEWPVGAPSIAAHNWTELRGYSDIPAKGPLSDEKVAELRHGYYACISYTDAQVGKLLDSLDDLGLAENTVVVLWGDHGFHLGEQDLWAKATNFELATRVPLIVRAPGMKAGQKSKALVELIDLYPTLLEACGLESYEKLEGTSFVPVLKDGGRDWKTAAFSQFPRPWRNDKFEAMGYTVRTEGWRYTVWRDWKDKSKVVGEELYDLRSGDVERENLAGDQKRSSDLAKMRGVLEAGWKAANVK